LTDIKCFVFRTQLRCLEQLELRNVGLGSKVVSQQT